jgi:hypothetical protein
MKLTKYGPGKFNLLVDAIAHAYTMMGAHDDETGDVETSGWFGSIRGPIDPEGMEQASRLSTADREFLAMNVGGAIVSEDSQGFVSVDFFRTEAELDEEWERIVEKVSEFLNDGDSFAEYE